ncbi:LapA family protein [Neptuniibacter caesariensis]|uniref:Lipopolysaccharide assembly protein A domain-containing protein n=1 Tax=Neptuniibacter caesariensis TaxID=207954 RepID=A0A7U8GS20_NEPCE|nr:LapA family protein [Neptuniibacter caesariensis]EAR60802.1 hypothetical protein MED92_16185 [Oceanospirillum sp. MED92] [Neptuniibacter caesariensis]
MRFIKKILLALLALLMLFIGVMITVSNPALVSIDLVFIQLPELTLGVWLAIVFFLGSALGLIIGSLLVFALRTRVGSLKRKLATNQKELDQLRVANLKDAV